MNKLYIVKTFDNKHIENNAYFRKLSEAIDFVTNNTCDINDCGVFDWVMIQEINYNQAYTECISNEKIFFTFNYKTNMYEEVSEKEGNRVLEIMNNNRLRGV